MPKAPAKPIAKKRPTGHGLSAVESPRSKRAQIVKAATHVFLTHGYEGTSVADVASAAGVIKATIYSHFKDKQSLFKAIMEDLTTAKGFDRFEADINDLDLDQVIEFVGGKISERDQQFRSLVRVVVGESGRFPEIAQLFYETVSARGNSMVSQYITAHPDLQISDPGAAAQIITGSMVYWMLSQEILGGKNVAPISHRRIVDELKELFIRRIDDRKKTRQVKLRRSKD